MGQELKDTERASKENGQMLWGKECWTETQKMSKGSWEWGNSKAWSTV